MQNTIHSVQTTLQVHFRNGDVYNIPMRDPNQQGLDNYCTAVSVKEQLYSNNNNNVVGNITSSILSITVQSKDGLLISSNTNSIYYGYMDNTAYIEVNVTGEDNVNTYLGRYFVDAWENGTKASDANTVNISAVSLIGRIKNISLRKLRLQRNLTVKDFIKSVVDKLNSGLPSYMQVLYRDQDLNIFDVTGYNWQLWYNNIDRDSFENIINNIAQNTLTNLWIDRNRYLKADWLLDDTQEQPVSTISGSVNVLDYGTNLADTSNASGVEVTYIDNVSYEDKELANIEGYPLTAGVNELDSIKLNSSKISNISTIEIINDSGTSKCVSFFNYKDSIDFKIISTANTNANIKIWGTVIKEIENTKTLYKDNNHKSDVVSINNNILRKELIDMYTTGLLGLISISNSSIYMEGFINPQVKIGDLVTVSGTKLGINGNYKVIGVELKLGTNYRCKLNLLKTFEEEEQE